MLLYAEKQKAKRPRLICLRGAGASLKSSSMDDSTGSSTSNQVSALALGLGPRFNWLENKIYTMQANTTTKLRPILPKPLPISGGVSSLNRPRPATTTVVVVATTTTTTSSPQTTASLHHVDVVTTQSSVDDTG